LVLFKFLPKRWVNSTQLTKKYQEAKATLEFALLICDPSELVYQYRLLMKEQNKLKCDLEVSSCEASNLILDLKKQIAIEKNRG